MGTKNKINAITEMDNIHFGSRGIITTKHATTDDKLVGSASTSISLETHPVITPNH